MIEGRRDPALNHVTVLTRGYAVLCGELASVDVGMAGIAIFWDPLELDFMGTREGLVAIAASDHAMSPDQIEFGLGMVEAFHIDPRAHIVASLAPLGCAVRAQKSLSIFEFTFV